MVFAKGYGLADVEKRVPTSTTSIFGGAPVTKLATYLQQHHFTPLGLHHTESFRLARRRTDHQRPRVKGGEVRSLGQPDLPVVDRCRVGAGRRRYLIVRLRCADPKAVAIRVVQFHLAPVRSLAYGAAELGHDSVDIIHNESDQGVWSRIASVL